MSFDIHGNRLQPGHCEVHPWVHEGYPCSVCNQEIRNRAQDEIKRDKRQQQATLCQEAGLLNQKIQLRLEEDKPPLSVQDNGLLIEVALFLTELNMRLEV